MATEGASGEPGSGGRRDSAATAAVTGLAGEGRGGGVRPRRAPCGDGTKRRLETCLPRSVPPPSFSPGAGRGRRERGAGSPSLPASLFPSAGGGGFSPPLFLPAAPARGGRAAPVRGHGGGSAPRFRPSLSHTHPPPLFPPLAAARAAAPRLCGRAEVVTAAGRWDLSDQGGRGGGGGEMLIFNALPGPPGACFLLPSSRVAFSTPVNRVPAVNRVWGGGCAPRSGRWAPLSRSPARGPGRGAGVHPFGRPVPLAGPRLLGRAVSDPSQPGASQTRRGETRPGTDRR